MLSAAEDAGLLDGEIDYGQPAISDLATTTVRITVDGRTVSQSAYALGSETDNSGPPLADAQLGARSGLQDFIDTAHALVGIDSEQYVPTGVVAYRLGAEASVDQPDLEQEPVPWLITTVPAQPTATEPATCIAVTGPEVPELLATLLAANETTPWLIVSDRTRTPNTNGVSPAAAR